MCNNLQDHTITSEKKFVMSPINGGYGTTYVVNDYVGASKTLFKVFDIMGWDCETRERCMFCRGSLMLDFKFYHYSYCVFTEADFTDEGLVCDKCLEKHESDEISLDALWAF